MTGFEEDGKCRKQRNTHLGAIEMKTALFMVRLVLERLCLRKHSRRTQEERIKSSCRIFLFASKTQSLRQGRPPGYRALLWRPITTIPPQLFSNREHQNPSALPHPPPLPPNIRSIDIPCNTTAFRYIHIKCNAYIRRNHR
jgi:hypothetical protein